MPNYLNQIESDLYKLYSITNGNGEVVEMVAELKEKYLKAKAFDAYHGTIQSHLHLKGEPEFSSSSTEVLSDLIDIHEDYERYAYDQILKLINKYESGEYDAKK